MQAPDGFNHKSGKFERVIGFDRDPLIAAAIAYEVAQDDFADALFNQAELERLGGRDVSGAIAGIRSAMLDAGVAFWNAAHDAGVVDLAGDVESFEDALQAMRHAGFLRWSDAGRETRAAAGTGEFER